MPDTQKTFRAGLIGMRSSLDVAANVGEAKRLIADAAGAGADYIQTPEMTTVLDLDRERLAKSAESEQSNSALQSFVDCARSYRIWLHIGSMAVSLANSKLANRAYVITPNGDIAARYDKIHMFDVALPDGETYQESANYEPGSKAVVTQLPWGGLGLTICYDLRFPYLHRALAHRGASYLAGPSAFTKRTGEAHWHVLLRARAIEAQCFMLAAAQGGMHEIGRATYGHSLVVSPWGEILAEGGEDPGVTIAEIDPAQIATVRARIPSLTHDRAVEE